MKIKRHTVRRWSAALLALAGAAGIALAALSWWVQRERAADAVREYEPPPPGMVLVPAGEFWLGSDDPRVEWDEGPRRRVFLRAFYIDRFEVTNRRYKEYKPGHTYLAGEGDLPVTGVLKPDAEAFCRKLGGRLPTGAEWEKAARGTDGRLYPWGNEFKPGLANVDDGPSGSRKLPGGSFPGSVSPYGCHDMAGNVWEWVSDIRRERVPFERASDVIERGIIRGGAHGYGPVQARSTYLGLEGLGTTCNDVGFRFAMDAVPRKR